MQVCISLTGPFGFLEAFMHAPGLTRAAFVARSHSADEHAWADVARQTNLVEVADRIECQIHIVGGALDRVIPLDHAERVSGPVELNMVEDGTHVVNNRPYRYRPASADWMARQLHVRTCSTNVRSGSESR